jgi:GGDEF domain-containing protein
VASTGLRHTRLLQGVALACFGAVFAAFAVFERPGLGVGHFFYVAIVLAGMSAGAAGGAAGGLLGTLLYALGIWANPHLSSGTIATEATVLRLVTFVLVGALIGHYASRTRELLARADELAQELRTLARRDFVTGLPNQRAFESAVNARIEAPAPFALVVCDLPPVPANADERSAALAFGERLLQAVSPDADVARIGNGQFAVVAPLAGDEDAPDLVAALERTLADRGRPATVGWATRPRDGHDALGLYTVAAERLYARKIARGEWEQPPASVTRIER